MEGFLREGRRRQEKLEAFLRDEEPDAPELSAASMDFQQELVALWDTLSLALCGALPTPLKAGLPGAANDVVLERKAGFEENFVLKPWPFDVPVIPLRYEARLFQRHFRDQADLDANYGTCPTVLVDGAASRLKLRPDSDQEGRIARSRSLASATNLSMSSPRTR